MCPPINNPTKPSRQLNERPPPENKKERWQKNGEDSEGHSLKRNSLNSGEINMFLCFSFRNVTDVSVYIWKCCPSEVSDGQINFSKIQSGHRWVLKGDRHGKVQFIPLWLMDFNGINVSVKMYNHPMYPLDPSKIEWDLPNGPLSTLLEPIDTQV